MSSYQLAVVLVEDMGSSEVAAVALCENVAPGGFK